MTPLAARFFRSGPPDLRRRLAVCQFFECTALAALANEMLFSETDAEDISPDAQLPADDCALELMTDQHQRTLYVCRQRGDTVEFDLFADGKGFAPLLGCAFTIGTSTFRLPDPRLGKDVREAALLAMYFLEKLLCLLNQPGLVERRRRDTDKRIMRQPIDVGKPAAQWHECRIYPGTHRQASPAAAGAESSRRPLHYVRRHFRPTLRKWVEGYWRGNADLGLHLKWYSPRPPARDLRSPS